MRFENPFAPSVTTILGQFSKLIDKLEGVIERESKAAFQKRDQAGELIAQANIHEAERDRADRVINRMIQLID